MIYYLLVPLVAHFSALNVFRYITFRSIAALLTALVLSIVFGPKFIDWLRRLKFGQYIHEDVAAHKQKAGTPTMGGLLIAFCIVVSVLLWGDLANEYVWMTLFVFLGFGALGYVDDHAKVVRKQNKGLTPKQKLLGQIVVSGVAAALLVLDPEYSTRLAVPFFKHLTPDLGLWYLPFAMLVMIGASNAVNLTDGLDGLAIGPMIVNAAMFGLFIYVAGHAQMARYLQVMPVSGVGEVTVFCGALVGAGLGFLWFNAYPAQIFMGDVGSLSLGGALGFLAVLCKQELLLIVVGGLYVAETVSVILQVGYFKMTGGKRIFRMAPLHHHFELMGVPESKIIIRFWILSILLALVGLSTLKLR
ncbi:phospho-N-acetylmuramoyl-pentapeptide-transferase [Solidesulfovibrio magneticus]|uniref:Phospho-N-acetylmuramoyl-pentapeptide-transferase n=1 Tax=Solidesulfovibrio magneticus (strain ATCC 700980 / DSM 13731 / RS-1) TaxID=573370 RepID=MRAY_SOLM1|nr:phospho-N-acetylmuramoyl-pentapeptide-transferase [Solidesulfovibrio magneticus]C4XK72.1 RecName: Full=Phospho-N-acetylmuramoyl-pentapeptide-transferase; AltName: Full=UDP-MurNAc-pentapeptide phosphotransferase [Solidesulfovibrio magneticus RS-1]BAH76821.1 phospho-N-acetylmuramoyl-pentapeptide-transferase [Solidesulfovibrio magneticus RS-1]